MSEGNGMRDRLTESVKRMTGGYVEVRFERTRSSRVGFRGRRLEVAAESVDAGGCVRVLLKVLDGELEHLGRAVRQAGHGDGRRLSLDLSVPHQYRLYIQLAVLSFNSSAV